METQKHPNTKMKVRFFVNKGGTKMEAIFSKKAQKRQNTKMETQNVFKQRWCQNGSDFFQKRDSQHGSPKASKYQNESPFFVTKVAPKWTHFFPKKVPKMETQNLFK